MKKRNRTKKVWEKLFGLPKGTMVVPTKKFVREYPIIWFHLVPRIHFEKIPTQLFIGEIVREENYSKRIMNLQEKSYLIKWIADRRVGILGQANGIYVWRRDLFNVLKRKSLD